MRGITPQKGRCAMIALRTVNNPPRDRTRDAYTGELLDEDGEAIPGSWTPLEGIWGDDSKELSLV